YDEGKRSAETLTFDFERQHGLDIRVARIFNTYGPRMRADDGRVVSNVICQALAGDDITVYGNGEQTRSFCYVSDLVDGLLRLMAAETPLAGPVNLGNPRERTAGPLVAPAVRMWLARARVVRRLLEGAAHSPRPTPPDRGGRGRGGG
ncbi:NAD-dependent epimerase/dehydratase family protein, partial [Methylobacterium radiotolerans]|uniref:NAD-dependent epimerase/dehydratase family protein n=1 Tax=Methylobacterium radiotolerans TaxID=31998 RepID=UPI000B9216CE